MGSKPKSGAADAHFFHVLPMDWASQKFDQDRRRGQAEKKRPDVDFFDREKPAPFARMDFLFSSSFDRVVDVVAMCSLRPPSHLIFHMYLESAHAAKRYMDRAARSPFVSRVAGPSDLPWNLTKAGTFDTRQNLQRNDHTILLSRPFLLAPHSTLCRPLHVVLRRPRTP